MRISVIIPACLLIFSGMCYAQDKVIKVSTITNTSDPASAEVMKAFQGKLRMHPNLFALVDNADASPGLLVIVYRVD